MKVKSFIILFLLIGQVLYSQLNKFDAPEKIDDKGIVYEFRKSNWDGTHASSIFLYIADNNKLESFKYLKGTDEATLVTAIIDWNTFSVIKFQNHKLTTSKEPQLIATLFSSSNKTIQVRVGDMSDSLNIEGLPWQSYDFDFAGLSFIWRAIKDKKRSFSFHIADADLLNGKMAFVNKGLVTVNFTGLEKIHNKDCYKYFVNGEGLENKGGFIWIDPTSWMIEKYMIALPDEPGFANGMLELKDKTKMTQKEWENFKIERLKN